MKINIFLGDSQQAMQSMKDNQYGLGIIDSEYGIGEDGSKTRGRTFDKIGNARKSVDKRTGRKAVIFNTYESKGWDKSQSGQSFFDKLFRVSDKHIIWGCNYIKFNQSHTSSGRIFWDKVNYDNDFSDGEMAWTNLFSSIRQFEFMWNGMLQGKGIESGRINQGNKSLCEKRIHPTQKPVQLYKWLLKNYGYNKDGSKRTIFDSHGGSMSIVIACIDMGFDIDIWELDPDYYSDAVKRIKRHLQQLDLTREPVEINYIQQRKD